MWHTACSPREPMRFSSLSTFVLLSMALVACGDAGSADADSAQASDLASASSPTSPQNPVNKQRIAMLEGMLSDLGKSAAADYAKVTGAAAMTDLTSTTCVGPKQADARYPGVSLGECHFTFKTANAASSTTFAAFVTAGIVIPGMPDPEQPNDPTTHEPPPATTTRVTDAVASREYILSGDVPALPAPIAMTDKTALSALGHDITARVETAGFGEEDGECNDLSFPAPKFAASEGVKTFCYTYYVDDDRYHGELLLSLQTDHHGKATGIRYFEFGGFD
jgi:hypothetical protein